MSDIELVIKIPENVYELVKHFEKALRLIDEQHDNAETALMRAIINGTPLSKTIDSLKELSKDHRHNFVGNSCEERAWRLGIEDSIDLILAESEE